MEDTMEAITPNATEISCEGQTVGAALAGALISGVVVAGSYVCVRGVVRGWARYQIRRERRRSEKKES